MKNDPPPHHPRADDVWFPNHTWNIPCRRCGSRFIDPNPDEFDRQSAICWGQHVAKLPG